MIDDVATVLEFVAWAYVIGMVLAVLIPAAFTVAVIILLNPLRRA